MMANDAGGWDKNGRKTKGKKWICIKTGKQAEKCLQTMVKERDESISSWDIMGRSNAGLRWWKEDRGGVKVRCANNDGSKRRLIQAEEWKVILGSGWIVTVMMKRAWRKSKGRLWICTDRKGSWHSTRWRGDEKIGIFRGVVRTRGKWWQEYRVKRNK